MAARRRVWRGLHGSSKHFSKATHTCRKAALRRVWRGRAAASPPQTLSKVALSRTFEFLVPWPSLAVQGGLSGLTDVLDGRAGGGPKSQRGVRRSLFEEAATRDSQHLGRRGTSQ